ncbi:MAG: tRNA epoxyqueuosine(34) reductase QueG [Anaerolineae bacterium]|nr:tRNA epoxyqueuosine(34) reductase QueG [Anaerolineae bacterium]
MDAARLRQLAVEAGLDLVGAVPVRPSPTWDAYVHWVDAGYAGGMAYLTRADAVARRSDPRLVLPQARTVLVCGVSYAGPAVPSLPPLGGRVARYAWGPDYHDWLLARLERLVQLLEGALHVSVVSRCFVDTGPVLERAWACAAGLGWVGKHGCLIHPGLGSFVLLGVALLDVDLPETAPGSLPSCGTCTACIDACPTGALVAPGVLDARRCLSYLTIENRGAIPEPVRAAVGGRAFGCDTCQDVCPWNRKPMKGASTDSVPETAVLFLPDLLTMDADTYARRFRRSPIWRATLEGLARNAAVVLGNTDDPAAHPYLVAAATGHPSPLVREHAADAIQRLARRS